MGWWRREWGYLIFHSSAISLFSICRLGKGHVRTGMLTNHFLTLIKHTFPVLTQTETRTMVRKRSGLGGVTKHTPEFTTGQLLYVRPQENFTTGHLLDTDLNDYQTITIHRPEFIP